MAGHIIQINHSLRDAVVLKQLELESSTGNMKRDLPEKVQRGLVEMMA